MILLSFETVINNHFSSISGSNPTALFQSNNHTKTNLPETNWITICNHMDFMFKSR